MSKRVLAATAAIAAFLICPAAAAATCTNPPPTVTWTTGLEHGSNNFLSASLWASNAGGFVDSTVARTGQKSLRLFKSATGIAYTRKHGFGYDNVLSLAIRLDELPSGDVKNLARHETTGSDLYLGYESDGQKLTLQWGSQARVESVLPVTAGAWHSVDLRWKAAGTSPMTAEWRMDSIDQQPTSIDEASYGMSAFQFGSDLTADGALKLRFDDIVASRTPSDYPIGPSRVQGLRPNSSGIHAGAGNFRDDDGTAVDPASHARLDDADMGNIKDGHVKQVVTSPSSYLEFGYDDTVEPCIHGVEAIASLHKTAKQTNHAKVSVFDGPVETVVGNREVGFTNVVGAWSAVVKPAAGGAWTPAAVSGLVARVGQSSDASPEPMFDALLLEVASPG